MAEDKDRIFSDAFQDEDEEDTQKDKYLTFLLEQETYGADIRYVNEVVGLQKITKVPDMPEFIRGVINLRSRVIPLLDVRRRFGLPDRDFDERTCVVVVTVGSTELGLVVDEVRDVLDIPAGAIGPPPKIGSTQTSRFVQGIGQTEEGIHMILDLNRILGNEELAELSSI